MQKEVKKGRPKNEKNIKYSKLSMHIEEELHYKFKSLALLKKTSMQKYIKELIENELNKLDEK